LLPASSSPIHEHKCGIPPKAFIFNATLAAPPILFSLLLTTCFIGSNLAESNEAWDAYKKGNYKTALKEVISQTYF